MKLIDFYDSIIENSPLDLALTQKSKSHNLNMLFLDLDKKSKLFNIIHNLSNTKLGSVQVYSIDAATLIKLSKDLEMSYTLRLMDINNLIHAETRLNTKEDLEKLYNTIVAFPDKFRNINNTNSGFKIEVINDFSSFILDFSTCLNINVTLPFNNYLMNLGYAYNIDDFKNAKITIHDERTLQVHLLSAIFRNLYEFLICSSKTDLYSFNLYAISCLVDPTNMFTTMGRRHMRTSFMKKMDYNLITYLFALESKLVTRNTTILNRLFKNNKNAVKALEGIILKNKTAGISKPAVRKKRTSNPTVKTVASEDLDEIFKAIQI